MRLQARIKQTKFIGFDRLCHHLLTEVDYWIEKLCPLLFSEKSQRRLQCFLSEVMLRKKRRFVVWVIELGCVVIIEKIGGFDDSLLGL
jgi:hypothetical protein